MKLIFSILLVYTILFASEDITISSANNTLYEKFIFNDLIANKNNFKTNNNHKLVNVYNLSKNDLLFLISSNSIDNSCHACVSKMSWYHLKKENNNWQIVNKIVNVEPDYGSWGSFDIPELIYIGKDKIAFKYIVSYSQQGISGDKLDIQEYDNFKFKKILTTEFGYSDSGVYEENEEHNNWESKMYIVKKDKPYYDIVITKKGKKNQKEFEDNQIFKYINGKYTLDKN